VTYCTAFKWVVGVLSNDPRHDIVVEAVAARARMHSYAGLHPSCDAHGSQRELVSAAVADADAVVTWGGGNYWPLPTSSPVIFVGHGQCQWTVAATRQAADGGATHFVGVSENAARAMRTVAQDVSVIMNGVDTKRLSPPKDRIQARARWYPNDYDYAKYVGYLGRLGNEKNVDGVIHAIAALPYYYRLVFIGCTGWRAGPILSLARTILRDRLIEVQATDFVGEQLGALDCMVQVSPREGHSLAICEGMFCRVPIVSTVTGAIPQLERMAGGDLIERVPDDPLSHEIAAAIRRVCRHPPVDRISAAERFAREHLTADAMCNRWTDYLQDVMQRHAC
jgi:glycosyltransferase involved in cell wall biosynthesis